MLLWYVRTRNAQLKLYTFAFQQAESHKGDTKTMIMIISSLVSVKKKTFLIIHFIYRALFFKILKCVLHD